MFKNIKTKFQKELGLFNYGTKCHGYDPDGSYAHNYRCRDADCPNRLADNEYYNKATGRWETTDNQYKLDLIKLGRL